MASPPIREQDLHAYVDGQLNSARRAEIEAYLAEHPQAAATVQILREQIQNLHREFDDVLNEPVPLRLTEVTPRRVFPRGLAAAIAGLAFGLAAGWLGHATFQTQAQTPIFAKNALAAHVLFVSEKRHPVEVPAAQEAHLVAWLSKRLDAPIRAPDLQSQGYSLLGGRLLPGGDAPLAQLMYESSAGERLTLIVKHAKEEGGETGFRLLEGREANVFYWIDQGFGYALSGNIDKARMLQVAHVVDGQLRKP
jgi:anti-sigma factor RsiW